MAVPISARRAARRALILTAAAIATVAPGLPTAANGQSLPAGWTVSDVASPAGPGTGSLSSGTFTVSSRGYDVNGASDEFTYVYSAIKGDVSLVAKVASLQNTDPWSQAGVMLRDTLKDNANHAFIFATPGNGIVFRSRTSSRGGTSQTAAGTGGAPVWLRIDRTSSTVTAYRSADGVKWTSVATLKLRFNQPFLLGLAVASHSKSSAVAAAFSDVSVDGVPVDAPAPAPTVNAPPTVSLNSPANGATYIAPASISIGAAASDSDGSVAKVDFYAGNTLIGSDTTSPYTFSWNNVPAGSYTLKAVATDNAGASSTSGSITVSVNANTPPTVSLSSPSSGSSFIAPASTTIAATAADTDGSVVRVDFYAGSTLVGSDTSSPYSVTWSNVASGSYVLTAVATDNLGASTVSAGVSITVNTNQAPTVSLTSPTTGSTFTAPATIGLTASASDPDGSIKKVDFYNGTTLLGTATTSPYSFNWLNVPAGSYSLSAVASDNLGATTVSSWSDVTLSSTSTLSTAIFTPAVVPDSVDYYVFEVYAAGADPSVAAPVASQNLGVPPVVNGECSVDVKSTIAGLAPGDYFATVSSVSSGEGTLRSSPFVFTR